MATSPRPSSRIADRISRRVSTLLGAKPPRTAAVQVRPSGTTDMRKTSGGDVGRHRQISRLADLFNADRVAKSRRDKIIEYREMLDEVVEFARAAEVITDFAYGSREDGHGFEPSFPKGARPEVIETATAAWTDLGLLDWGRSSLYEAITLGDSVTRLLFERNGRLAGECSIPPEQFEIRIDRDTKTIDHYRWIGQHGARSEALLLAPFEVIHYAHDKRRGEFYGRSIFSAARGLRRRHEVVDDILAMLALRKASGDVYWLWPFGSKTSTDVVDNWINEALDRSSMTEIFDDGGSLRKRVAQQVETAPKVVPYRVLEDYPELSMKPSPVQVEPPNLKQLVELLDHQQGRMFVASGVPKALAGLEKDVNSRATLEQQGVHFAMTVGAKQDAIGRLKTDIMIRACLSSGIVPKDGEIGVRSPKVSAFDEAIRAEVSKERALATEYYVKSGMSLRNALLTAGAAKEHNVDSLVADIDARTTEGVEDQLGG